MVNDVSRAIEIKDGLTLLQELKELENSLRLHFANEEKIARAVNFPYAQLKSAQQCSLNALQHLMNEIEAEYGMWPEDTSHFLETWVIEHITQVDMPMKPMLQAHEYNFWPGWHGGEANPALATPSIGVCGCRCDSYSPATG